MIEIEVIQETTFIVFSLKGALDSQVASDFDTWFEQKISNNNMLVGIDLLQTTYLSSMGIGSLKKAHNTLKNKAGILIIYNLNHEIQHLISFLHLDKELNICKTFHEVEQLFKTIANENRS